MHHAPQGPQEEQDTYWGWTPLLLPETNWVPLVPGFAHINLRWALVSSLRRGVKGQNLGPLFAPSSAAAKGGHLADQSQDHRNLRALQAVGAGELIAPDFPFLPFASSRPFALSSQEWVVMRICLSRSRSSHPPSYPGSGLASGGVPFPDTNPPPRPPRPFLMN